MKITYSMIDKEYRLAGLLGNILLSNLSNNKIKLYNWAMCKSAKTEINGFNCWEEYIDNRDKKYKIRVKIYRPLDADDNIPCILYLHGGGYALCTPRNEHFYIKKLLKKRKCMIVAPDYSLSINRPFPAAINDCYDTLEWMMKNKNKLAFRDDQIFTAGASAGGGLVAAINIMARDIGKIKIAYQMPLYPMLDDRMDTPSMEDNNSPWWNKPNNTFAWSLYLGNTSKSEVSSYAAPSRNTNFIGLPPITTFIGTLDPFFDETIEYINNFKKVGIKTSLKIYDDVYHGFEMAAPRKEKSKEAVAFLLNEFSYAVDNYFSKQALK